MTTCRLAVPLRVEERVRDRERHLVAQLGERTCRRRSGRRARAGNPISVEKLLSSCAVRARSGRTGSFEREITYGVSECMLCAGARRAFRFFVLALALGLTLAGAANAEFPTVRGFPGVVGTPQDGQTLEGRKGQWLLADGLNCTDCTFTWTWQRCAADGSGCADVPGRTGFSYLARGGRRWSSGLRLVEWVYKRDCGEINYSTGQQECHDITKNAVSAPTRGRPCEGGHDRTRRARRPRSKGLRWRRRSSVRPRAPGPAPAPSRRCSTGSAATPSARPARRSLGATGAAYRLTTADVGARIRVVETASNEGGTAQAVSTPSAVVVELRPSAARPTIAASKVALPQRLNLRRSRSSRQAERVTVQVTVSDTRGFQVAGARVALTPTGLLVGSARSARPTPRASATFTFAATGSGPTYLYAEARKAGEQPQTGVSTAKLFRIRVR